jgi:hypothetical protein
MSSHRLHNKHTFLNVMHIIVPLARLTRRLSIVEQELPTRPEHLSLVIVGVDKAETSDVGMSTNKSYKQCNNYYVPFITT